MPRTAVASVLACLALGACDGALDVDYRGRRQIAEGDFRIALPLLFGSERYVLAAEREKPGLRLLPFDGGEACDLGSANRAVAYWTADGLRIGMYDENDDGTDRVQFYDGACEPHLDPFDGLVDTSFSTGRVLAETADHRLLAIDPWRDDVRTVSKALTRRGPYARDVLDNVTGVWLLEGERLLRRDFEGERLGDAVDGVVTIAAAKESADEFLVVTARDTFVFSADAETEERVAAAGCSPRLEQRAIWLPDQGERRVSLLSPCEKGRLVAVDLGDDDKKRVTRYADGVLGWWHRTVVAPTASKHDLPGTWTFYLTAPDTEGAPNHVWIARPSDAAPAEIGVDVTGSSPIWPWIGVPGTDAEWTKGHGVWLLVTHDGVLGSWSAGAGFVPIAEGVERVGLGPIETGDLLAWIVLHDSADGLAALSRLSFRGTLETIAEAVAPDGLVDLGGGGEGTGVIKMTPPDYDAVLRDFDGAAGEIALLGADLVPVATGVPPNAIREFTVYLRGTDIAQDTAPMGAVAYLHDFDAERGVGSLAIRLEDGRAFEIDRDVSSFRPSGDWIDAGIVYAIGAGPRRGIWFARQ